MYQIAPDVVCVQLYQC